MSRDLQERMPSASRRSPTGVLSGHRGGDGQSTPGSGFVEEHCQHGFENVGILELETVDGTAGRNVYLIIPARKCPGVHGATAPTLEGGVGAG